MRNILNLSFKKNIFWRKNPKIIDTIKKMLATRGAENNKNIPIIKVKNPKIFLKKFNNYLVSDIKSLKPVEPYKGKGIKERNQYVLRKEGKKK